MAIFSDGGVEQFSMSNEKTKCAYYVTYEMAPYLQDLENLYKIPFHPASFDKTYNNAIKQGQMDLYIRYWNSKTERLNVHYINSSFMAESSASDDIWILVFKVLTKPNFYRFFF